MERLKLRYQDSKRALKTLQDILKEQYTIIVRDATIQRFEDTFEAFWKFVKEYLKLREGITCNSPKSCFRELFSLGMFLSEEGAVKLLQMVDDRNMVSHTYIEEVAQILYKKIDEYCDLIEKIVLKLEDSVDTSE